MAKNLFQQNRVTEKPDSIASKTCDNKLLGPIESLGQAPETPNQEIHDVKNDDQSYLPFEGAKPLGYYIYRPWIMDPKTGKRKYPRRAKVFKIWVPYDKAA